MSLILDNYNIYSGFKLKKIINKLRQINFKLSYIHQIFVLLVFYMVFYLVHKMYRISQL